MSKPPNDVLTMLQLAGMTAEDLRTLRALGESCMCDGRLLSSRCAYCAALWGADFENLVRLGLVSKPSCLTDEGEDVLRSLQRTP
jgi:hypothetical protein